MTPEIVAKLTGAKEPLKIKKKNLLGNFSFDEGSGIESLGRINEL